MPMSLNQLFPQAERDLLIRELTLDSRGVRPGDLFLAVPGGRQDGRAHIADALAKGAAAVAYEAEGAGDLPPSDAPLIAVKGLAAQLSAVAGRFYGEPSRGLDLIGVTGTNGKTSVSQLVAQAWICSASAAASSAPSAPVSTAPWRAAGTPRRTRLRCKPRWPR